MRLEDVILRGDRASQPAATTVPIGTLYYVTDETVTERSNGTVWQDYSDVNAGSGITTLTGDVTAGPGSGSQAATIPNDTITTNKIINDAVTDAKIRESAALSVIGRSANSTGNPADISATPASAAVLRESGSVLGFGTVATAGIANDAITYPKIQNVSAASKLLGRGSASGAGDVEEITLGTNLTMTGTTLDAAAGGSGIDQLTGDVTAGPGSGSQAATIANDAVTYAKMQNVSAADRLLGRGNGGGSGDVQEIALGTNLSLSGTTLNASGGSSAWTTITKSADQTKSADTTFAADSELQFALSANTTYRFRGRIYINYTAAGFFKTQTTGPASPTYVDIHSNQVLTGGAAAFAESNALTYGGYSNYASGSSGYFEFDGIIINGANAGTFAFEWAQIVASGSATVKKGSWLEYSSV